MQTKYIAIALAGIHILSLSTGATAATRYWRNNAGSGNWSDPSKWSSVSAADVNAANNGVPGGSDIVNVSPTDNVARTITYDVTAPTLTYLSVDLTGAGTNRTTFNTSGNNLNLINGIIIGDNGRATFNQSAGTVVYTNTSLDAVVGFHTGGDGIYNLGGTGVFTVARGLYVGTFPGSTGEFNQSGGTTTAQSLVIGANAGATGTYTISGGTVSTSADILVGNLGTGTLTIQNGGSVSATTNLSISGTSILNLNGGTLRFNSYTPQPGSQFNYNSGTIKLGGGRAIGFDTTISALYGATPVIAANKSLTIEGDTEVRTNLTVNGGTLTGQSGLFRVGFNNNGSVAITNGGTMVSNVTSYIAVANNVVASVNVDGVGSSWSVTGDLYAGLEGKGTMNITDGGTVTTSGDGLVGWDTTLPSTATGSVLVSGAGSMWNIGDDLGVGSDAGAGTMTIEDQAMVYVTNGLFIGFNDTLNINGGTIRFNTYIPSSGAAFNFNAGTVQLAGNRSLGSDAMIQQLFGAAPKMVTGKGLSVEGTATLLTTTTLDGGTLSANQLVNGYNLKLQHGTFNLTNQAVTIAAGGLLGDTLDLAADITVNVTLGITNQGLVTGDGQVGGTFANAAGGELRASAGRTLKLTGSSNTNAGQIELFGGELEFTEDLTNNTGAFVSGNGTLIASGGLVNHGTMNFSGAANLVGNVINSATGKIISSGGGPTTFYDDVINSGEIRTSTNGFTVFFGEVSGGGTFTGTGTVNFEGDLSPGNSPAAVSFAGNVVLGAEAMLSIELGGTTLGTFDRILVAGDLSLDGLLEVSILPGFTPGAGQSFDILNWGTLDGEFFDVDLPTLAGLTWNTSQLYTTGVLSLAAAGLLGDYNNNGEVDAADYSVWRDALTAGSSSLLNDPTPGIVDESDFLYWRAHFGQLPGGGASAGESSLSAVPEPTAALLSLVACAIGCCSRRHFVRPRS